MRPSRYAREFAGRGAALVIILGLVLATARVGQG